MPRFLRCLAPHDKVRRRNSIRRWNDFHSALALVSLVLVLAGALGPAGVGQAQAPIAVKLDSIDISQFPTLAVSASVVDENGWPVTGLSPKDFEVVEDGRTSAPPDEVMEAINDKAAVSVLVLIDLAGTMKGAPLEAAKAAAASFLEKLINEPSDPDRAAIIGFGAKVDITSQTLDDPAREVPFTNDATQLRQVVDALAVDGNAGTPLYDAVYRAIKVTAQQPGRRAIIVMTDGADVGSTLKDVDPISEAQRQHIPVFTIGLSNSRLDKSYLTRLAELTGGQYQEAPTPEEIGQKFEQVLSQIKVQYLLTYVSRIPQMDGQRHSLLLRVMTPRGQGYDEAKFQLGEAPTPTGTPVTAATPAPESSGTSALPTATTAAGSIETPTPSALSLVIPTSEAGMENASGIVDTLRENPIIIIAMVAAVFLLLLLVVLVFVFMRRRSKKAQPQEPWGAQQPYYTPPASPEPLVQNRPAAPKTPSQDFATRADAETGGATFGPMREVSPGSETEVAPAVAPPPAFGTPPGTPRQAPPAFGAPTPPPFGTSPAAPTAPPPFGPPAFGQQPPQQESQADVEATVVIQKGPKMKYLGLLVNRKQLSNRYDVDKSTVSIGRQHTNNIMMEDPTVSRQHATIKLEGDQFVLYDLGSANGTFVDGERVREPVPLHDGAIVKFGELEFSFKLMSLE